MQSRKDMSYHISFLLNNFVLGTHILKVLIYVIINVTSIIDLALYKFLYDM